MTVRDARGRKWSVTFGREVHSETFASRIARATGYFIEPVHFIAKGRVLGIRELKRAKSSIQPDGTFTNARFQIRDPAYVFSKTNNWTWTNNPFLCTRQLGGLKIVMMLTSNWDNKDARNVEEGINTAIFERPRRRNPRYIYAFTDWGGTMGHWGNYLERSVWKCHDFAAETDDFVRLEHGKLKWGYKGRHDDFFDGLSVADVVWVTKYLGRIRDAQLRAGLRAAGATPAEIECYTRALRQRIDMLKQVARASRGVATVGA